MRKKMIMVAVGLMAAMTFAAQCAEKAQDGVQGKRQADVVVKLPGIQKIDMENLLDVPVGSTLLGTGIKRTSLEEDVMQIGVPLEWSERAKCRALRVSHLLVDNLRLIVLGGLGSNVYPTIAEGAFAMTNEVVSAVWKVSDGKAMVVPLRFEKEKGYCEMIFTWRPDPKKNVERELIVRGFVNASRQMAVCTCFHTKGDTIKAELSPSGTSPVREAPCAPKQENMIH